MLREWANRAWLRGKTLWKHPQLDRELNDEVAFHLAMRELKNRAAGMDADEARYAARRQFGNATGVKDRTLSLWRWEAIEALWQDVRYGARSLRKSPAFTIVAVLTLALGTGAPTAIFSVIDSVMLQPLPFRDADQLVSILTTEHGRVSGGPSALDMRDYAEASHSFQSMVAYDQWRKNVNLGTSNSEPEQMIVGLVPAEYFLTLDVRPLLGRLFTAEENQDGQNYVAAIDANLWRNRFASDPAILGRQIRINEETYTIVAVMPAVIPPWLEPRRPIHIWTPFVTPDNMWAESSRGGRGDNAIGRLKPGVTVAQAQADLATIAAGLAAAHPIDHGIGVVVAPLSDKRVGQLQPVLFLLMGAVTLVLLIACANLANLLLGRNAARQRELAVRAAIGAGRWGLVRQLLAETLLLSLLGGAAGLAVAQFGLGFLTRAHLNDLPQLAGVGIHAPVLLFTLATSLLTSVLFGLAPALTGTRMNVIEALKEGGRSGSAGASRMRLRNVLVAAEVALSLVLVVGASLLVQSIVRLQQQDTGARVDHLLKGHFYLPPARYRNAATITRFADQVGQRVRAVPGVISASVTTLYPPNSRWRQPIVIAGRPAPRLEELPTSYFGVADASFLRTLGIPLLQGRDFAEKDTATSSPVALISDEFRRRFFPNEDPIGRQLHIGPPAGAFGTALGSNTWDSSDVTVIGVIGNIKNAGLARAAEPEIVCLYAQHPVVNYGFKDIVIRTAVAPHSIEPAVRKQIRDLDADMVFAEVETMDEMISDETGSQRFTTMLLSLFTAAGLALAIVGVYGVVSYLVAQRKQELAVRVALGATPRDVLWLVLQQGLKMAVVGAAIGMCGAWALRPLMGRFLFGISPADPVTFAGAAIFLLGVAAAASAIPGVRVMRLDPAHALRQD
jgi:putative ABC transport system permease protein